MDKNRKKEYIEKYQKAKKRRKGNEKQMLKQREGWKAKQREKKVGVS